MAMRRSTRSELNKLREVVGFLLQETRCPFCGDHLLDADTREGAWELEGTGRGVPVDPRQLSIHHEKGRGVLTHYTCHMRFEAVAVRVRKGNRFVKGTKVATKAAAKGGGR